MPVNLSATTFRGVPPVLPAAQPHLALLPAPGMSRIPAKVKAARIENDFEKPTLW